ncbi:MAG: acyltransferase [Bacteroidetes bacterium]|nr:MAG: acyltransferase [Bacteroidota bacterium]
MIATTKPTYLPTVDVLRGIAAMMVCYFHFSTNSAYYGSYLPDTNWLNITGKFGWLGVEVFFVISGFIIPFSLFNNKYKLSKIWIFLKKRWVRIEPPYIITIFLILLNWKFNGWLWSYHVEINWYQVISHFFYLPQFLGFDWINEIFWTLAIEFQFYIFISVAFIGFNHQSIWVKLATAALFLLSGLAVTDNRWLTAYSSLFLAGIAAFWYRTNQINKPVYIALVLLFAGCAYFQFPSNPFSIPIVTAITSGIIAFVDIENIFGRFIGKISYSLYLVHGLIGGNFLFFTMYVSFVKDNEWVRSIMILGALLLSITAAWIFNKLIEQPSQHLSKKINL